MPCVAEVVNRSLKADCTDLHNCLKLLSSVVIETALDEMKKNQLS